MQFRIALVIGKTEQHKWMARIARATHCVASKELGHETPNRRYLDDAFERDR